MSPVCILYIFGMHDIPVPTYIHHDSIWNVKIGIFLFSLVFLRYYSARWSCKFENQLYIYKTLFMFYWLLLNRRQIIMLLHMLCRVHLVLWWPAGGVIKCCFSLHEILLFYALRVSLRIFSNQSHNPLLPRTIDFCLPVMHRHHIFNHARLTSLEV